MADSFKATLITPEAIMLETQVSAAQVPAFDGMIGILNRRAPLLAKLGTGLLRLQPAGQNQPAERFLISGGYAQMKGDELTILTSQAVPAKQITPQMISAEETKLNKVGGDDLKSMNERQAIQARLSAMRAAQTV